MCMRRLVSRSSWIPQPTKNASSTLLPLMFHKNLVTFVWAIYLSRCAPVSSLLRKLKNQSREQMDRRRPALVSALHQIPDFYMEIKWDFQTWGESRRDQMGLPDLGWVLERSNGTSRLGMSLGEVKWDFQTWGESWRDQMRLPDLGWVLERSNRTSRPGVSLGEIKWDFQTWGESWRDQMWLPDLGWVIRCQTLTWRRSVSSRLAVGQGYRNLQKLIFPKKKWVIFSISKSTVSRKTITAG